MATIFTDKINKADKEISYVARRVRLDVKENSKYQDFLEQNPYSDWLKNHVEEIMRLKNEEEQPLFLGVVARGNKEESVFVTDFIFATGEDFAYFVDKYMNELRDSIKETYDFVGEPDSPFKYTIAIFRGDDEIGSNKKQRYDKLLPPGLNKIATSGCYNFRVR